MNNRAQKTHVQFSGTGRPGNRKEQLQNATTEKWQNHDDFNKQGAAAKDSRKRTQAPSRCFRTCPHASPQFCPSAPTISPMLPGLSHATPAPGKHNGAVHLRALSCMAILLHQHCHRSGIQRLALVLSSALFPRPFFGWLPAPLAPSD